VELVVGAAIIRKGEILLVRKDDTWIFPGGKLKEDETPEYGLVREINEELSGLKVTGTSLIGIYRDFAPSSGYLIMLIVYRVAFRGKFTLGTELAELMWTNEPETLNLAPATAQAIAVMRKRGYL